MPAPTVYVIDDDLSVLKALARLIRSAGYRVETFDRAVRFLDHHLSPGPGCLVLDVQMPDLSGLDLQQEMASRGLLLPIIFLTGHGNIPMSVKAMKAGAVDFLTKPAGSQELLEAIRRAIEKDIRSRRERVRQDSIQRRIKTLTPREYEVLRLVISGMLNKQMAYELGIREKTVKVHRARVMEKMRAGSLAELVHLTERVGLGSLRK